MLKDKIETQDLDYVTPLHQYTNYCGAVRETIRMRDQKQIDHEELLRFQAETTADRDRTRATGKSPGISGFFKDKINDFKGVDPEKTRAERLEKLEAKLKEVLLFYNISWTKLSHPRRKPLETLLLKSYRISNYSINSSKGILKIYFEHILMRN